MIHKEIKSGNETYTDQGQLPFVSATPSPVVHHHDSLVMCVGVCWISISLFCILIDVAFITSCEIV